MNETSYSDQIRNLFSILLLKKLNTLRSPLLYILQATQKLSDYYTSNQASAAAIIFASKEK